MACILTDDHLESLQCTKCRKYLSVFPVKNHSSRDVTCGRCSDDDSDGVRSTLYELIALKYLFRCINRYEGCRKLLRADETAAHEKVCLGNVFRCPKCDDDTDRSVLELIWHYKRYHQSSYLKRNCFEGRPPSEDAMLYVQDDVVFVVLLRFESGTNELRLCAVTLTDAVDATQIFFVIRDGTFLNKFKQKCCKSRSTFDGDYLTIHLDSDDPIRIIFNLDVSKPIEPYSFSNNVSSSSNDKTEEIETVIVKSDRPTETVEKSCEKPSVDQFMRPLLTEPFQSFSGYHLNDSGTALVSITGFEIDLTCSNCKEFIGQPVYQCKNLRHYICLTCRIWCGICNCAILNTQQQDTSLSEVNLHLKYPCKWKCGRYFTSDLRTHESACKLRIMECPMCSFKIHFEFMKHHLQNDHEVFFCGEYDTLSAGIKTITEKRRTDGTVYFLLNDKWCYLNYIKNENGAYSDEYYFTFFSLDEKLNTKLKIIHNSENLHAGRLSSRPRFLCRYRPYLDFNET